MPTSPVPPQPRLPAEKPRSPRTSWRIGALLLAVLFAATIGAVLVLAFTATKGGTARPPAAPSRPVPTASQVAAAVDRALPALARGDRARFSAALAGRGSARAGLRDVFAHLAPLPLSGLHALVNPVGGAAAGVYDVQIVGKLGGAGPPDRLLADRVLAFALEGGRGGGGGGRRAPPPPRARGARTPPAGRREYLMAMRSPRAIVTRSAVVVYDGTWKPLAQQISALVPAARARVADIIGARAATPIVVALYTSRQQVADSLGREHVSGHVRFFAQQASRPGNGAWTPADIGIVGPDLINGDPWTPYMLAHEVAHTVTWRWFFHTQHSPALLEEGLGMAVELGRTYAPLKAKLAAGDFSGPLLRTFAMPNFWDGAHQSKITLEYLEAGSVVGYVLSGWGKATLHRFVVDVADSTLEPAAVKAVVRKDLGVSWPAFYEGWRTYTFGLP
jgi:hypothetical protein